jgi:hypothetical protein
MSSRRRNQRNKRITSLKPSQSISSSPSNPAADSRSTTTPTEPHAGKNKLPAGRSRKLSGGRVTIVVATISAVAGIATAALNGMFNLASSHSAQLSSNMSVDSTRLPSTSPSASTSSTPTASTTQPASGPLVQGDESTFIGDVTYPDGTKVPANQHFVKKWEIKNIGSVRWIGRYLVPDGLILGDCTYPSRVSIPTTSPGRTVIISVPVTASSTPQLCYVTWKMANTVGDLYFPNEGGIWFNVTIVADSSRLLASNPHPSDASWLVHGPGRWPIPSAEQPDR